MGRQAFGTRMVHRETFLQIQLRLLQHLIRGNWIHGVQAYQNRFTHQRGRIRIKRQFKIRDASPDSQPKIQSSLVREILQIILAQTNNDCRFQIFISTNSLHQEPFACWKTRFKTEVCTLFAISYGSDVMHQRSGVGWFSGWIKLRHLSEEFECQILKYSMRGLLQHCTESSIIPNSRKRSVWRNKKVQKHNRFLRGRQIAYLIYEYFRVTGSHDSVENYADLFTIALRNDDIQEFDSKWDEILLSMTQIPSDEILEGLYKLRIRGSEKLKTVLELYNMEIHQKKVGPDYHRLKTMVKRSIEQDLRNRNFGTRNGNYERNAVVKNQGTKQRGQRILGDCWQWEANGQCPKGDNCSFRHDVNKRAKNDTAESVSEFFHAAGWKKNIENPKSQRQECQW